MSMIANLAVVCERLKKYDEVYYNIEKLKGFLKTSFSNEKVFRDIWSKMIVPLGDTEISYYIFTCQFDKLEKITERILEDTEKYTDKFAESRKILVYNLAAYAYFINKKYSDALKYINKTLNYKNTNPEEREHSIARIFNLIIHFEMKNYELLEYILSTTKKYLTKKDHFYRLEEIIIKFMEDSLNINNDVEMTDRLKKLKYDVITSASQIQDGMPLGFFDIESWLDSKINKRNFSDVLKEKRLAEISKK